MELLAGGHRNSVLKLCTAHLDNVLEFLTLLLERVDEILEALLQFSVHPDESVAEGRRIGVVGRLGAVHMVVR